MLYFDIIHIIQMLHGLPLFLSALYECISIFVNVSLHKPTLSRVLLSLMVNKVSHTTTIAQSLLMVKGLECLTGAV